MLEKDAREPHDPGTAGDHPLQTVVQEAIDLAASLEQIVELRGGVRLRPQDFRRKYGPRRLQHAVQVTFGIRTDLWKERAREDPLARKRTASGMGGRPVEARANSLGKPEAEVQRLRGDATRGERSLEQAKSDRRREERTERHADEHDVGRRATAFTVSGDRERRRLTPLVRAHTAHHSRVERWCR